MILTNKISASSTSNNITLRREFKSDSNLIIDSKGLNMVNTQQPNKQQDLINSNNSSFCQDLSNMSADGK